MADTPIMIGMESMLERLAFTAWRDMSASWIKDPVERDRQHDREMAEMGAVIGAEAMMLSDARKAGWNVPPPDELAEHSLAMRLPDGRIGYHMPDRRYENAPDKRLGDPIREHLTAFLTGRGGGIRQHGLPELPAICRDVLRADGLDPDAVERLGAVTRRITLTVEGRHHVARLTPRKGQMTAEMDRAQNGDRTRTPYERYEWKAIKMVLSKTPPVHVLDGKLTAKVVLPAAIASSLAGRPATAVLDHPALRGHTIARATQRPSGFTINLAEGQP